MKPASVDSLTWPLHRRHRRIPVSGGMSSTGGGPSTLTTASGRSWRRPSGSHGRRGWWSPAVAGIFPDLMQGRPGGHSRGLSLQGRRASEPGACSEAWLVCADAPARLVL